MRQKQLDRAAARLRPGARRSSNRLPSWQESGGRWIYRGVSQDHRLPGRYAMPLRYVALPTHSVRALQAGGADAYGMTPERRVPDGDGVPCRHCLRNVEAGAEYLILAYRPFPQLQPYAETGPIFIHAESCTRAAATGDMPEMYKST